MRGYAEEQLKRSSDLLDLLRTAVHRLRTEHGKQGSVLSRSQLGLHRNGVMRERGRLHMYQAIMAGNSVSSTM
jgi:hypothetical protein